MKKCFTARSGVEIPFRALNYGQWEEMQDLREETDSQAKALDAEGRTGEAVRALRRGLRNIRRVVLGHGLDAGALERARALPVDEIDLLVQSIETGREAAIRLGNSDGGGVTGPTPDAAATAQPAASATQGGG